jgi:hypothetical protein
MYVLVGTCWIVGTVYLYLCPEADSPGTRPLGKFQVRRLLHARSEGFEAVHWDTKRKKREGKGAGGEERKAKEGEYNSQPFQRGLNIRKFEEDGPVRDMLIVKHEADAPDNGREADVLGAGQVVQNNLGLGLGGHVVLRSNEDSIEEIKCNCRVSNQSIYMANADRPRDCIR